LGSIDSGSNPGSPTKFFRSKMQNFKSLIHRRIVKGII
jgi:hypothetical protein